MQTDFKLSKPEEVEFTLTVTLPLAAWKKLHRQLTESQTGISYPANDLRIAIVRLVENAESKTTANFAERVND